jgi:hypothetical protein
LEGKTYHWTIEDPSYWDAAKRAKSAPEPPRQGSD